MEIKVTDYAEGLLNEAIRKADDTVRITHCLGQRFIGAGLSDKTVEIDGIPGNALGAYLNGAVITVHANAQDAVGDTMNAGEIIVHGNVGDAAGYSMRGGQIFVKGNAGYRAGIHMKAYCHIFLWTLYPLQKQFNQISVYLAFLTLNASLPPSRISHICP